MSLLIKREVILAKVEVTYNTDPVPVAATDAVLVQNPSWSFEGARLIERPVVKPSLGMLKQLYGGALKTVTLEVEVRGSGTIDLPPDVAALLRACGWAETINAAVSVVYDPASTALDSVTIYYFQDGIRHIITGCRGNVSMVLEAGDVAKYTFTMTGHFSAVTDVALPAPTFDATVPPVIVNVPFTIGGNIATLANLAWDMGNAVATPSDIRATDGFGEVQITNRDVNGSFDPEAVVIATIDFLGDFTANAENILTTGVIGSVSGNRLKIDMPVVAYREVAPGDRDAIRTFEVGFGAAESTTDDEITLTYT